MLRSCLALLTQAWRVDSRQLQAHLFRSFFVGLIFVSVIVAQQTSGTFSAPGLVVFSTICYLNAMFISLAALSYFATAISEEKEEGTLGLLKMTGMSPVSLLLGKSTSRLVVASLALAVQLPFTFLSTTLGGVLPGQIAAAYLALLAYLIGTANLGLLCSVVCRTSRQASGLMVVLLGAFFIAAPLALWGFLALLRNGVLSNTDWLATVVEFLFDGLNDASIFNQLRKVLSTGFTRSSSDQFQLWTNMGVGAACFCLAWSLFERCTSYELTEGKVGRIRGFKSSHVSTQRAWRNSILWKDFRFVAGGRRLAIGKFIVYGVLLVAVGCIVQAMASANPNDPSALRIVCAMTTVSMLGAICVESGLYASRVFSSEQREKTWPLLIILPTDTKRIFWSKIAGCSLGLVPAASYFLIGAALFLLIDPVEFGLGAIRTLCSISAWSSLLYFLFFLHLTAYLSLHIRHGALAIAFVLVYLFCTFIIQIFFLISMNLSLDDWSIWAIAAVLAPILIPTAVINRLRGLLGRKFPRLAPQSRRTQFRTSLGARAVLVVIFYGIFWLAFAGSGGSPPFAGNFAFLQVVMSIVSIALIRKLCVLIDRRVRQLAAD